MIKDFYFKYRIFIIPGVVGIICLSIIIFVIIPQVQEIFKERENGVVLANKIAALDKKSAELAALDQNKLQQDLVTALTIMPTGRDVPEAMAVLQDLITKSNLELKSTSYSAGSAGKADQNSFQLTISVMGSLSATREFLNNMRMTGRVFKVDSIALRFQPEGSSVAVDLPLTIFYQPAPATVLTVDQPVSKITSDQEKLVSDLAAIVSKPQAISTATAVPVGKADPFAN